jgi:A/G-specific adenine glycosylase
MLEGLLENNNVGSTGALMPEPKPATILEWYDRHARRLPWRMPPAQSRKGRRADPYHVWLSEVMLQQTTVVTVGPYFQKFLDRWPHVSDLAAAPLDDVLTAWAGLGYYARARNLHKCAQRVVYDHAGVFPDTEEGLRELPGIGPYTAAAIAAIAFNRNASPMDGNIERVMSRLFVVDTPMPAAKPLIREHAIRMTPNTRPGDYAQAVMDLGATVCTPRSPKCGICPWQENCRAFAQGLTDVLPRRTPKPERPVRRATAYWMVRKDGAVLLRRRPESGLLGGMMEVPSGPWEEIEEFRDTPPVTADWVDLPGLVEHGFTHLRLELKLKAARVDGRVKADGVWIAVADFDNHALPTLTRKVVRHVLAHVGKGIKL